jgi:hypothetical protein
MLYMAPMAQVLLAVRGSHRGVPVPVCGHYRHGFVTIVLDDDSLRDVIYHYCLAWPDDSCCLTLLRGGEINGCARPSIGNLVERTSYPSRFVRSY